MNSEKTRTGKLHEPGVGLNFLGYTFRYDRDRYGRDGHYLNLTPSRKSLQQVRDRLREMTDARQCFTPIRQMMERINRMLRGWQGYYSQGYPGQACLRAARTGRRTGTWTATPCDGCVNI